MEDGGKSGIEGGAGLDGGNSGIVGGDLGVGDTGEYSSSTSS